MKKALVLAAIAMASVTANAQDVMKDGWYAQSGLVATQSNTGDQSLTGTGISFTMGKKVDSQFSIEGQFLSQIGYTDYTADFGGGDVETIGINVSGIGIFGKYTFPASGFDPYIRVGVMKSTAKARFEGLTSSADETGFAIGAGIDIPLTKQYYLNIDATRYHTNNSETVNGLKGGIGFRF